MLLSSPEATKDRRACGLHHDKGVLTLPECKKPSESEGAFFLYKETFGFARNISAHHTKRLSGQATALQIVVFIDFLLRLLDTAQHSRVIPFYGVQRPRRCCDNMVVALQRFAIFHRGHKYRTDKSVCSVCIFIGIWAQPSRLLHRLRSSDKRSQTKS